MKVDSLSLNTRVSELVASVDAAGGAATDFKLTLLTSCSNATPAEAGFASDELKIVIAKTPVLVCLASGAVAVGKAWR